MSNRRHPKQVIALHGNPVAAPRRLPFALLHMEWSDFEPDTDCPGLCASVFYRRDGVSRAAIDLGQGGQQIQPSHEWYRPSATELEALPRDQRHIQDHVMQGGLLVREVSA